MVDLVKKIELIVKNTLEDDTSGHDWYHINRVVQNAKHIQSSEGGNALTIEIAALLHDISDHKLNGGILNDGGRVSKEILLQEGASLDFATDVAQIIDSVSFKGAEVKDKVETLEAKIVQDADRLDAIGAIGIARAFAYGGAKGQAMYDPNLDPNIHSSFEEYVNSITTSINHFHEKLLLLKDRLHTATAKRIGQERHDFMLAFLKQFDREWNSNFK